MSEPLRLGVIRLGRAFTLMLPTFMAHPLHHVGSGQRYPVQTPRGCCSEFGAVVHETAEALCADPAVQAVYIASPHQFHVEHVKLAAAYGKHALVEKPMALSVADCLEMIAAAEKGGVRLLMGHCHSYDLPYAPERGT